MTEKYTISQIKEILSSIHSMEDPMFQQLSLDMRKGVQTALKSCQKRIEKEQKRAEHFIEMQYYERLAYKEGANFIAGVDEVGRGPLAGPVVAAAVILPKNIEDLGFDDSKKLSASKREEIYRLIQEKAIAIGIGIVDADIIDQVNIYQASRLAMQQAVSELKIQPDYLLIDAMKIDVNTPQIGIIKGDAKSISIAAASIVAKQVRDQMMQEFDELYPGYDFSNNAGYGTTKHLEGLNKKGICPIHRKTFAPIKDFLQ
ncbi:ribonuclease HII [uncultured Granulicatella sp.]|uniref:ribonuclease HII n=1 Tax=uncultured Granulicatella sp. TaxID=316089 RepID=UPI0028D7734E|nr:ribonuclease HII [uncultured Granulicatella sp.]